MDLKVECCADSKLARIFDIDEPPLRLHLEQSDLLTRRDQQSAESGRQQ
ncbi:hypothetical protein [Mesorhizobium sp. M0213]